MLNGMGMTACRRWGFMKKKFGAGNGAVVNFEAKAKAKARKITCGSSFKANLTSTCPG